MLLPRPTSLRTDSGEFVLSETASIRVSDPRLAPNARLLQAALRPARVRMAWCMVGTAVYQLGLTSSIWPKNWNKSKPGVA